MSLFESKKTKESKSHLKNLLILCFADGNLSQSEYNLFTLIGEKRLNLTKAEIESVIKNPKKVKFKLPKDKNERFYQLWDLIILMFVDGKVTQSELDFCTAMATKLKFKPSIVVQLVQAIINSIEKGQKKEKVKSDLADWINN